MSKVGSNKNAGLPLNEDIWVKHILPFVGMGHFAFIAAVNHSVKDMYVAYCDTIENPPPVFDVLEDFVDFKNRCCDRCFFKRNRSYRERQPRLAISTDTFYQTAVFASVTRAEYWFRQKVNDLYLYNCARENNVASATATNDELSQKAVPASVASSKYRYNPRKIDRIIMACIAQTGNLEIFLWALKKKILWDSRTCSRAAKHGHLLILMYAHEYGCPWNGDTCASAAANGHLECLQYAHENRCFWFDSTCSAAAGAGHLKCLQYAHENGCVWKKDTCISAAQNGQLECLQYAYENGCPWDIMTIQEAARNGHLECLHYAHEKGCLWNEDTCQIAAESGHLECL